MDNKQFQLINSIQKIVIYETKARFYVVGSNNIQTKFRILKIDRTEPRDLIVNDDHNEYSRKEIRELLLMIEMGNQPRNLKYNSSGSIGLRRTISAFGIVGFVRFLEGYYIVLITKRCRVSLIGPYTIFKVEDTVMLPIPNESVKYTHPDEQRYVKMFQNIDLSSNYYFSYSYDLTHTLQYILTPCTDLSNPYYLINNEVNYDTNDTIINKKSVDLISDFSNQNASCDPIKNYISNETDDDNDQLANNDVEEASIYIPQDNYDDVNNIYDDDCKQNYPSKDDNVDNNDVENDVCIFGKSIYLTLIARRSNKFAGTRFLKRGANLEGNVANEVEIEQIVYDSSVTNFYKINFTSFVQLRGSIPLHWSQDVSKMVPKPTITIDQGDPFGFVAGQHFNRLFARYGTPVIILDLVKRKERKKHESLISDELSMTIQYLNKFLPVEHRIQYVGFDMARANKTKNSNVLHKLSEIAEFCLKKTNFFNSKNRIKQCGVVRTNCIDCLDRTNTAQFAIGKHALALQLFSLGIIETPKLEFDTDCLRILEDLYEDVGDTLALQYGGSQLVHRIRGYRKVSPWTSSSRDIMQTLSRYCRNTFSDNEKQQSINLLLGIFRPVEGKLNIWDLTTDFYLHNVDCPTKSKPYTQWLDMEVFDSLPKPYFEESKCLRKMLAYNIVSRSDELVNSYIEFYIPHELSSFDELYTINMPNSIRDFMPKYAENVSAFIRRTYPRRGNETIGSSNISVASSLLSKNLSTGNAAGGSESGTSGSEDDECDISRSDESIHWTGLNACSEHYSTFKEIFKKSDKIYGVEMLKLKRSSDDVYYKYLSLGTIDGYLNEQNSFNFKQNSNTAFNFFPQNPSDFSLSVYKNYINVGNNGPNSLSPSDLSIYKNYLTLTK